MLNESNMDKELFRVPGIACKSPAGSDVGRTVEDPSFIHDDNRSSVTSTSFKRSAELPTVLPSVRGTNFSLRNVHVRGSKRFRFPPVQLLVRLNQDGRHRQPPLPLREAAMAQQRKCAVDRRLHVRRTGTLVPRSKRERKAQTKKLSASHPQQVLRTSS